MDQNSFTPILLRWFDANGRDLPWRHRHDAYAIWLSEIILQQTRVVQGTAYWQRMLATWPTVDDLAAATEDEVLKQWQGLGYYSRARNLHTAARQIVALGHFPDTYDEIRKLKGVGDYTAAAIASFAYGIPVAAVDGNAYRVLSRIEGIDTPINSTEGIKLFKEIAQNLVPQDRPGDFNQAMMDLGATICTPRDPHCDECPFVEQCVARREGRVADLPVKNKTVTVKERWMTYIIIRCKGYVALHQRGKGDIWQGLWEPFLLEGKKIKLPNWKGVWTKTHEQVKHVLTHRILWADSYVIDMEERPSLPNDYIWIREDQIKDYAIPRLVEILWHP
ncbi:MAG: A/G-specific adenine glycosylase [Prevotella sp.]|nr:A/G-specific adenine glycosylase [Prevotella sp.]